MVDLLTLTSVLAMEFSWSTFLLYPLVFRFWFSADSASLGGYRQDAQYCAAPTDPTGMPHQAKERPSGIYANTMEGASIAI